MDNKLKDINMYKETNSNYVEAQNFAEIIRLIQRKREEKEINQIISYINSLNKNERNQLLNICRQIANIAPNKNILSYINSLTTPQIINLFNHAISHQRQLKIQQQYQKQQSHFQTSTTQLSTQTQASQSALQPSQQTKTTQSTSTIYSQKNAWSPISFTGTVYKFNRGVIGIDRNGQKYEIVLDSTNRHHNDATAEIGLRTNCFISNRNAGPFQMAIDVANQGTIIIQLEGDSMLVYLPDNITERQKESLERETSPRQNFELSFTHKGYTYSNVNTNDFATMCQNIIENTYAMQRTR